MSGSARPRVVDAGELLWSEKAPPSGAARFSRKKLGRAAGCGGDAEVGSWDGEA